jgi:hypothetical protein
LLFLPQWTLHGVSLQFVLFCTALEKAWPAYGSSETIDNHHCLLFDPFVLDPKFVPVFILHLPFGLCC